MNIQLRAPGPSDWQPWDTTDLPDPDYLADIHAQLRAEFPAEQVGKLDKSRKDQPRGTVMLDYVGHGAVTSRLLEVDPLWWWEPMALDTNGLPLFDEDGQGRRCGLWIKLHVGGMWRPGYGSCPPNQDDPEKVLIGDAIRNAAMRFGVALDLWVRGHDPEDQPGRHQRPEREGRQRPAADHPGQQRTRPADPDPADLAAAEAAQRAQLLAGMEKALGLIELHPKADAWLAEQLQRGGLHGGVADMELGALRRMKAIYDGAAAVARKEAAEAAE